MSGASGEKAPTVRDGEDMVIDSGMTAERRSLYEYLGNPFGEGALPFLRWISMSRVTREGSFPGGREMKARFYANTGWIELCVNDEYLTGFYAADNGDDAVEALRLLSGALGIRFTSEWRSNEE